MNHLHDNKIVHRNLKPSNVYIDANLYPYIANFYHAKQIETPLPYFLKNMPLKYAPPELLMNYKVKGRDEADNICNKDQH